MLWSLLFTNIGSADLFLENKIPKWRLIQHLVMTLPICGYQKLTIFFQLWQYSFQTLCYLWYFTTWTAFVWLRNVCFSTFIRMFWHVGFSEIFHWPLRLSCVTALDLMKLQPKLLLSVTGARSRYHSCKSILQA